MQIRQKLADDDGLDEDLVIVDEHRDETAGVEGQEGGRAGPVDVDDSFFVGEGEFA